MKIKLILKMAPSTISQLLRMKSTKLGFELIDDKDYAFTVF